MSLPLENKDHFPLHTGLMIFSMAVFVADMFIFYAAMKEMHLDPWSVPASNLLIACATFLFLGLCLFVLSIHDHLNAILRLHTEGDSQARKGHSLPAEI